MTVRWSDAAWIAATLVLLVPVALHVAHPGGGGGTGAPAPAFEGESALDSLLGASLGKPVILNFWATWCTPCMRELPEIESALSSSGRTVSVIAVDMGDPDPAVFRDYASSSGLSFPLVWVGADAASRLEERFNLPGLLPVTLVLDGQGGEVRRISGARDAEFFAGLIEGLEEGPGPSEDSSRIDTAASVSLHINLVGTPGDPAYDALESAADSLAGPERVTRLDPSSPADSQAMAEKYLPFLDHAYAQACVGDACGRPASDPGTLRLTVESLR